MAAVWIKLRQRPELVFVLVLLWKAALLLFTAQPIPANDSFFYDGAVVNRLIHGAYCNPAIANALPISGNEVFSAYPPLYQVTLLGWMSLAGTSVLSAMWLHFVLFALYAGLVLATLRELRAPVWAAHFSGLFLLGITFHDRPDSLAHVFGMAAVLAVARAFRIQPGSSESRWNAGKKGPGEGQGRTTGGLWRWLAATGVILCLCTSLQIGGVYFLLIWLVELLTSRLRRARPHWLVLGVMTFTPVVLVLGVKLLWPLLWAGFREHAHQTPSLTSWRKPELLEVIKIVRAVPGLLLVLGLLPLGMLPAFCQRDGLRELLRQDARQPALLLSSGGAATAVLLGALFFLTANFVLVTAYLQPLVIGLFLVAWGGAGVSRLKWSALHVALGLAVLLAATRAIGLTTVGVACARDVSRAQAMRAVARELAAAPAGSSVAVSAAFLYDAWPEASHLKLLHSDWLGPAEKDEGNAEAEALCAVKPTRLILTQFDYYRRYVRVLAQLQSTPASVTIRVEDLARLRPPDASPRWQRVVQHVSWAPVIVTLEWAGSPSP